MTACSTTSSPGSRRDCESAVQPLPALLVALALLGGRLLVSRSDSWVEDEVTFVADGLTIHGTYRHLQSDPSGPAALLISESGNTDRNGDNAVVGPVGNMRQLAEYLSDHGVATPALRQGRHRQDRAGPVRQPPGRRRQCGLHRRAPRRRCGSWPLRPAPTRPASPPTRIGEGTTHAMALATDTDPAAPKIHSLGLLQPLPGRYLDLITDRVRADNAAASQAGQQDPAAGRRASWRRGRLPSRRPGPTARCPGTSCPTV